MIIVVIGLSILAVILLISLLSKSAELKASQSQVTALQAENAKLRTAVGGSSTDSTTQVAKSVLTAAGDLLPLLALL